MADGPVIQASSQQRARAGNEFRPVARPGRPRERRSVPLVLFSYLNPIIAAGTTRSHARREAGFSGLLLTDLPVGADPEREAWVGAGPLAFIRLVAPTTPRERMREIAAHGSGFVYLISRLGVTGMRDDSAGRAAGDGAASARRDDAAGVRRLWRLAAGASGGGRANRRRRRRRQRDRSRRG